MITKNMFLSYFIFCFGSSQIQATEMLPAVEKAIQAAYINIDPSDIERELSSYSIYTWGSKAEPGSRMARGNFAITKILDNQKTPHIITWNGLGSSIKSDMYLPSESNENINFLVPASEFYDKDLSNPPSLLQTKFTLVKSLKSQHPRAALKITLFSIADPSHPANNTEIANAIIELDDPLLRVLEVKTDAGAIVEGNVGFSEILMAEFGEVTLKSQSGEEVATIKGRAFKINPTGLSPQADVQLIELKQFEAVMYLAVGSARPIFGLHNFLDGAVHEPEKISGVYRMTMQVPETMNLDKLPKELCPNGVGEVSNFVFALDFFAVFDLQTLSYQVPSSMFTDSYKLSVLDTGKLKCI